MAEKPEDQVTAEEKIQKAKELYGRGCRNYYVKCYTDAADDLSEACKLYGETYGVDGDELGEVYLLYAKALVAVGQDENKLIEVPENEDADEPAEEDDGDTEAGDEEGEKAENADEGEEESTEKTNGHSSEEKEGNEEPQAGPSTTEGTSENENSNDAEGDENEDDGGNLEVAWEVLQNAALIFQRQEEKGLSNLLEVYNEMAGISIENGNFGLALDDFERALNTFDCVEEPQKNYRIAAEIHYKIGLCQSMEKAYTESVKSFQKAHDILSDVIQKEKAKEEQTEDVLANIKDMEETQQEIMNKITEIGEVSADEREQIKKEFAKLYGMNGTTSSETDGAGCSSSSATTSQQIKSPTESDKPKPTDISHLIKRKKPDTAEVESSPAKRKAIETSPEKVVAVPVVENENKEKVVEEAPTVQVAVDN